MRTTIRGVTLFELMTALVVCALLASLATAGYTRVIERLRIGQAVTDLEMMSMKLERWHTNMFRFPDTLADAGLDGLRDPWGHPYRYLNITGSTPGDRRRDKNLVPINTDFDLYSVGKDGKTVSALTATASRDDIVRANNGAFIGVAGDY